MNKLKLTIALTGLSNIDNPSQGTPFIRCLRNSDLFDCRFIGLVYDHMEPSIYMNNLSDKIYIVPNPLMGDISLLPSIRAIHEREQIDVLFPLLDPEISGFINESPAFEINPRRIYYAMEMGHNIPEMLVKLALGMEVQPKLEYRTDKVFYRYSWEASCNLADFNKLKTTGEL